MAHQNASNTNSYKLRKEEFVSNLNGTSMLEIAALSAVVPGFMVLGQIVASYTAFRAPLAAKGGRLRRELVRSVGIELTVVILPILACLTVLAESVNVVLATLVCVLLACFLLLRRTIRTTEDEQQVVGSPRRSFLSSYRCAMMLVTCITILAVDFTIYPRRLAKTETYGTGLMDVGVGSFVVANALVSRQARGLPPMHGAVLRSTSPLLILGFARLFLTKGVDYQEHVAEYGLHWNFFFTLAAVTLLTSVIQIPASVSGLVGLFILAAYQAWLSSGLNEYLLSSERGSSIVSLNKEGLYSTLGYWALYLISVQLGFMVNQSAGLVLKRFRTVTDDDKLREESARWYTAMEVCGLDALFWILAAVTDQFVERVSRRTCNLAYVLFVLGQNFQVIGSFALAEAVLPLRRMIWMDAFDQNLLPTFLLANVLTGLVNLSTDTISATPIWAFSTLIAYLAFLAGGMTLAQAFHLRLKFW